LSYRITIRTGPRVEHERRDSLDDALELVKRRVRGARRRDAVEALGRRYEPGRIVAIRIELKGPHGRAGLDVLGDGGLVAFTGRWVRKIVGEGEDPYEALRRALTA
jgi:hypothetical protein